MTEDKEFESLDALFKKTFEAQANTNPASNGWDTPSDKVWQHIQHQITPPQTGWTIRNWAMLMSMGAIVLLGLYLMFKREPVQPIAPTQPDISTPPAVVSVPPATPPQTAKAITPEMTAPLVANRAKSNAERTATSNNRTQQNATAAPATRNTPEGLLPASIFAPNTTVLREMEIRKRAPWKRRPAALPNSPKESTAPLLPDWMKTI